MTASTLKHWLLTMPFWPLGCWVVIGLLRGVFPEPKHDEHNGMPLSVVVVALNVPAVVCLLLCIVVSRSALRRNGPTPSWMKAWTIAGLVLNGVWFVYVIFADCVFASWFAD